MQWIFLAAPPDLASALVGERPWMGSAPWTFDEVAAGTYTACVVALPFKLVGPDGFKRLTTRASQRRASCQPITVAAEPDVQSIALAAPQPLH